MQIRVEDLTLTHSNRIPANQRACQASKNAQKARPVPSNDAWISTQYQRFYECRHVQNLVEYCGYAKRRRILDRKNAIRRDSNFRPHNFSALSTATQSRRSRARLCDLVTTSARTGSEGNLESRLSLVEKAFEGT